MRNLALVSASRHEHFESKETSTQIFAFGASMAVLLFDACWIVKLCTLRNIKVRRRSIRPISVLLQPISFWTLCCCKVWNYFKLSSHLTCCKYTVPCDIRYQAIYFYTKNYYSLVPTLSAFKFKACGTPYAVPMCVLGAPDKYSFALLSLRPRFSISTIAIINETYRWLREKRPGRSIE